MAYDLAAAKTVLSLGAPLLDGWGTPANVIAARAEFPPDSGRGGGIAHRGAGRLSGCRSGRARRERSRSAIAGATRHGGEPARFRWLADARLAANGPSLVIGDAPAVLAINRLLGAWGKTVVAPHEAPVPERGRRRGRRHGAGLVPDHSIRVLLIDESAAGELHAVARDRAETGRATIQWWWRSPATRGGYARHAQYALPTAVYPEVTDDIPPAVDSSTATFRISAPLVPPPAGMVNPADFVGALAGLAASELAPRTRRRHPSKPAAAPCSPTPTRKSTPVKELKADDFWKALNAGGCWTRTDAERSQAPAPVNLRPPCRSLKRR